MERRVTRFLAAALSATRARLGGLRWYPGQEEMAGIPVDSLRALRKDSGTSVTRTTLLLLSLATFCLVALQSPDSQLLSPEPEISLPFVGSPVSFPGFVVVGPILLFGLWMYLNVAVTYHRKLGEELRRRAVRPLPTLSEMPHPFFRVSFYAAYLLLVPLVMLSFTHKSMAVPGLGVVVFLWTLLAAWAVLLAAAASLGPRAARWSVGVAGSAALLALGVLAWREPLLLVRPYELYRADLSGAFLPNESLQGARAMRANLEGAVLIGADLRGADLGNADLRGADLSRARLGRADFGWADLREADLSDADLRGAKLRQTDVRRADLRGVDLREARIVGVSFEEALLQNARLDGAEILDSIFENARLDEASLDGVTLQALLPRHALERALGVSEEQLAAVRVAKRVKETRDQAVLDAEGKLVGWIKPWGLIYPWDALREPTAWGAPDPDGLVARAAHEAPVPLPEGTVPEPGGDGWSEPDYSTEPPAPDFGDAGAAAQPGASDEPANAWKVLVAHAATHPEVQRWLLEIVAKDDEPRALRRQALTALLTLEDGDAARMAYESLMDWIERSKPGSAGDVDFRQKTVRKYLALYAIRNRGLPRNFALELVRRAYGRGWKPFLEALPERRPFYDDLSPEQERLRALTVERARGLLSAAGSSRRGVSAGPCRGHSRPGR